MDIDKDINEFRDFVNRNFGCMAECGRCKSCKNKEELIKRINKLEKSVHLKI